MRVTISDMGPVLLGRLLDLTEVQCGVLHIAFRVADDNGLLLIDLKDLRSMLTYLSEHRSELVTKYGNVTPQSVGAIQRALLKLEDMGGDQFFGEPSLEIKDWMRRDEQGKCASSKKNTMVGFSGSPTSGRILKSSVIIQSKNVL